jgi:hypothetical protein
MPLYLPWYARFAVDAAVIMLPVYYAHTHPTLFMDLTYNSKRLARRLAFQEVPLPDSPALTPEQVQAFRSQHGLQE